MRVIADSTVLIDMWRLRRTPLRLAGLRAPISPIPCWRAGDRLYNPAMMMKGNMDMKEPEGLLG